MKYIINRESYLLERIVWLDNKQQTWDQNFTKLIMSFHDSINDMIDDIKDRFNDKDDPDEVYKAYMEHFEKAFDNLTEEVRNVVEDDDDNLHKLWNELVLDFSLWKDSFSKMSEKLDNYNSIFKLGYEFFARFTLYTTKGVSKEYYDGLKGEIDDKRQNVISFIEKFYEEMKVRLEEVSAEDVFSMSNLDEKDTDELALDAGDEVRYVQNDGEENIAIISHNQEELQEVDNIRLVSKTDGDQFEIDKKELIEILPKHRTMNQEVSDKLKKIKSDPESLDKLNDYLDELAPDVNESKDESKDKGKGKSNLDWTKQEKEIDATISDYQTKLWMSNHQFKRINIKQINTILRNVYKPIGHWKKRQLWGVVNLPWENTEWSILNKINTNYSALTILINEVNRSLKNSKTETPLFIFGDKQFSSQKWYDEYYRMIKFLDKHRTKLFLKLEAGTGSKIINAIIKKIQDTSKSGDSGERLVISYLPRIFTKDDTVSDIKMPNGGGEIQDMSGGIDLTFNLNGEPKTIQVKRCKSVLKGYKNKYRVIGTSIASHYNVDYLACVSRYNLVLFRYDPSRIELLTNGDIKLDESLLIKNIKLK